MHWRAAAKTLNVSADEILSDSDEEYALYNFLFECRHSFAEAYRQQDLGDLKQIIAFVTKCLRNQLETDGEDIELAAGVSFAEHLFDDVAVSEYEKLHIAVGNEFYSECAPWVEKWVEPDVFQSITASIPPNAT